MTPLLVAMLGFFVVALDAQIVNLALPDIGTNLGGSSAAPAGPVLGRVLTGLSRRTIFWVNLRVGAAALSLLGRVNPSRRPHPFDVTGLAVKGEEVTSTGPAVTALPNHINLQTATPS